MKWFRTGIFFIQNGSISMFCSGYVPSPIITFAAYKVAFFTIKILALFGAFFIQ
jgi:hypothetical protein